MKATVFNGTYIYHTEDGRITCKKNPRYRMGALHLKSRSQIST